MDELKFGFNDVASALFLYVIITLPTLSVLNVVLTNEENKIVDTIIGGMNRARITEIEKLPDTRPFRNRL